VRPRKVPRAVPIAEPGPPPPPLNLPIQERQRRDKALADAAEAFTELCQAATRLIERQAADRP
jgi:hypothetical protein